MDSTNGAAPLVYEYNSKKLLAKLGYRFSDDELTAFDAQAFTLIANEYAKLEQKEMSKNARKR